LRTTKERNILVLLGLLLNIADFLRELLEEILVV